MSDLQCPARFILITRLDGSAPEALRHERVAAVYDAPPGAAATELAAVLGVPAVPLPRRLSLEQVLARDSAAVDVLAELADVHRGETVVVLAEGGPGRGAEVRVDGDGVAVAAFSPGDAS